jgi:hypothetical protein
VYDEVMSTTFRTTDGAWVCTRWAGRQDAQAFDFGSTVNLDRWVEVALLLGDVDLVNEDTGRTETTLLRLLAGDDVSGRHGRAALTFGEFGGTADGFDVDEQLRRMGWES